MGDAPLLLLAPAALVCEYSFWFSLDMYSGDYGLISLIVIQSSAADWPEAGGQC